MPYQPRVLEDIAKLRELSTITANKVRILNISGNPSNHIELELNYPTYYVSNSSVQKQTVSIIHIDFLGDYPLHSPKIKFLTPIFHPNVYSSNFLCIEGVEWKPTEFLDLLVKRVIRIICFDPQYTNPKSPANPAAASWYNELLRSDPHLFPTMNLSDAFSQVKVRPQIPFRNIN